MADKKQGYLQKAKRQMKKKGTIGAFTDYCGGKVTQQCIERALNSNDDTLRRRAQFAKNVRAQSGLMNEKNGGATATAPPASQPVAPNVMQPIQQQPIQQQQPMQQQLLQQPQQLPQANAAPASEDPTAAGVNAASNVAQTVGQGLEQSGGPGSSKQVGGKALGGAAKGAAFGANPALVAATGGLSIAAGALIGGASGFIKGKKEQKQIEGQDLASQQTQGFQQIQQMDQLPQAMYGAMRMEKGGAKKLPGGVMKPIGYGAYKFMGNKHDEAGMGSDSGIILEEGGKKKRGLEVEDGELQVDVDTKDGEKEYIVSNYIKNPTTGNTLAEDLERELKRAKNNQEAAKITARYVRLNEQLRGKEGEPEKVKAQEGTFTAEDPEYVMPAEAGDESYQIAPEGSQAREFIEGQSRTELGTYEKEGEKVGTDEVAGLKENNPWFNWDDFDPSNKKDVERFQKEYNEKAPEGEQIKVDGKLGAQTASAYVPYEKKPEEQKDLEMPTMEMDEEEIEDEGPRNTPAPAEEAPAAEAAADPAKFTPRMPGTMLQAAGPLAALLGPNLTTKKMKPETAREIRMGRTNLDPERAAAAQRTQAASEALTSGLGGSNQFAMQQKNLAAGDVAQGQITNQETRSNIGIASQEKGINVGVRQRNAGNIQQASGVNAAAENRNQAMQQSRDIAAFDKLGSTATQTVKDYNQQYANYGSDMMNYGPVAADYYANIHKGNTPFGLGSRDIRVVNDQAAEVEKAFQPKEGEAKRGRYIKKSNKVRRKKRRK
jgi:hypothetical protein